MINRVNGRTRTCGLIGNPVAHTLSPLIHNSLAEQMGHDLVYLPFSVEKDVLTAVKGAYELNVLGLNVTVPYKQEVMKALCDVDAAAEAIGAVNTLVRTPNGYKGYNTDYLGLKRAAQAAEIAISGRDIVIVGAGGAAMAAAYLSVMEQAASILILNRTEKKAQLLADRVKKLGYKGEVLAEGLEKACRLSGSDYTVFQTTSVGLFPNVSQSAICETEFFSKVFAVYEFIYNPAETEFMKLAAQQGAKVENGMMMLLYQAIAAYELWNDTTVPAEVIQGVQKKLEQELNL